MGGLLAATTTSFWGTYGAFIGLIVGILLGLGGDSIRRHWKKRDDSDAWLRTVRLDRCSAYLSAAESTTVELAKIIHVVGQSKGASLEDLKKIGDTNGPYWTAYMEEWYALNDKDSGIQIVGSHRLNGAIEKFNSQVEGWQKAVSGYIKDPSIDPDGLLVFAYGHDPAIEELRDVMRKEFGIKSRTFTRTEVLPDT